MSRDSIFNLDNRTAVVTGASSGLGVQLATTLVEAGARVALVARREEKLKQVKNMLAQKGGQCEYYPVDVTDPEQVETCINKIRNDFSRIDILVNNAGYATIEPIEEHTLDKWHKVMETNVTGVFLFTKYAGKVMIEQHYGKIINISSMYGAVGNVFMTSSSYHASKGAVNTFTLASAAEWAGHNITVNAIGPGFFRSEMTENIIEDDEFMNFVKNKCPMQRTGKEGELEGALLLFASDASSYITGQILYVDGGWTSV
ncbi:SDR family oxidoreductase [Desulfonatronospira sp.]|uniref:SDR family NAD(P)-dependent oxidoreductase n=1 Tax=Desulfonatronospira sp. TaxID=1962951 RepID=UPI0025BFF40E|nr:SDR family oxidoreductase [Desulfonatronospira sp.]